MDLQLAGKLAFVSGSSRGIGFAVARMLAAEGARVVVSGREEGAVETARAAILAAVPAADVHAFAGDLASAHGCAAAAARFAQVDILVNNLGIYRRQAFEDSTDADWEDFFHANVMSGVRLARAWLPAMKRQDWGRIVFISSESAIQIPPEMIHYGMSKTAQLAISRGLAETCAGTGVTVNAVLPGPTLSDGVRAAADLRRGERPLAEYEREFFASARPSSLLRRFATPDEVASLVTYVCSPRASATNGAALRVDGGVVRSCC